MRTMLPIMLANFFAVISMVAFVVLLAPLSRLNGWQEWQASLFLVVNGVAFILLSRSWGKYSDIYGRKPVLLLALFGLSASYALMLFFLEFELITSHLGILLVMLLLRGAMSAFHVAIPISSQAIIADNTQAKTRMKMIALVGSLTSLGMLMGAFLSGLLVKIELFTPLVLGTVLPLFAAAFIMLKFPAPAIEPHQHKEIPSLSLWDSRLRPVMIINFVAIGVISIAQITTGFYAIDKLGFDKFQAATVTGYAMTTVGIMHFVIQGGIVSRLHIEPWHGIQWGALTSICGLFLAVFSENLTVFIAAYALIAAGMGFIFPSIHALSTLCVDTHEQGSAAGNLSYANGLAMIIFPVFAMLIYDIAVILPYLFAAIVLSAVLVGSFYKTKMKM